MTPADGQRLNAAIPATITLIVPALNEQDMITPTVRQIVACVEGQFLDYEVLLVNDGSTDGTGPLMERLAATNPRIRVLRNRTNRGLGYSYRLGVEHARCEYVMLLCGDGGMPASSLPAIFARIGTADIVIPYVRNLRQIKTPARFVLSKTYTALLNTVFGLRLRYYNGLPVHRVDLVRALEVRSDGFGFQGEILVKLLKAGCSFVQVGVDGAEKTKRSSALRLSNIVSVTKTLLLLLWEVSRFDDRRVRAVAAERPASASGAPDSPGSAAIV
jgi:glycosyltransferase involved in cell wall biosynthesis